MNSDGPRAGEDDPGAPDPKHESAAPAEPRSSDEPAAVEYTPQPPESTPSDPAAPPPTRPTEPSEWQQPPRHGGIRRQEPGVTQPRPPTVAEARARDKARKKQAELAAAKEAADAKRRKRNRRLIGGAAVVGVVGVVALGYMAFQHDEVTAHCVRDENGQEVVVEDRYCNSGSPGVGGFIFLGGSQYRYYYGGNSTIGQRPTGGSTTLPKGAEVKTTSGTTIQRGGLGSKLGGSSGS